MIYQQAVGGNTLAAFFYLKAHRPIYRDRLNIDIEHVRGEIEERIAQLGESWVARTSNSSIDRLIEQYEEESFNFDYHRLCYW